MFCLKFHISNGWTSSCPNVYPLSHNRSEGVDLDAGFTEGRQFGRGELGALIVMGYTLSTGSMDFIQQH